MPEGQLQMQFCFVVCVCVFLCVIIALCMGNDKLLVIMPFVSWLISKPLITPTRASRRHQPQPNTHYHYHLSAIHKAHHKLLTLAEPAVELLSQDCICENYNSCCSTINLKRNALSDWHWN